MIPRLVLAGRPNVGKSTLFNKLTGTRQALVADVPGVTRDRRYGRTDLFGKPCLVVDTGGLAAGGAFGEAIDQQASIALAEAWRVVLLVDARDGLTAADEEIASYLRRGGHAVSLVVNKIDGRDRSTALAEFSALGFGDAVAVSATRGQGLPTLIRALASRLPDAAEAPEPASAGPRLAIVGRPNVGKSTLINRLLGEERQIVLDCPGTTRDAVEIPWVWRGEPLRLIDTAGVRRRGRISETVEKFSVAKAFEAMASAEAAVILVDAEEGLVDQDLHILQLAGEAGAGLVLAINKSDRLTASARRQAQRTLDRRLRFVPWAPKRFISALRGQGLSRLLTDVLAVCRAGAFNVSTPRLNEVLQALVRAHPPPSVRGRQIKLRYAHKLGAWPPKIGLHGNQTESLPAHYIRFLEHGFRDSLGLIGNPVILELRSGANPYADRRNKLTRRQVRKRRRMLRHRK